MPEILSQQQYGPARFDDLLTVIMQGQRLMEAFSQSTFGGAVCCMQGLHKHKACFRLCALMSFFCSDKGLWRPDSKQYWGKCLLHASFAELLASIQYASWHASSGACLFAQAHLCDVLICFAMQIAWQCVTVQMCDCVSKNQVHSYRQQHVYLNAAHVLAQGQLLMHDGLVLVSLLSLL